MTLPSTQSEFAKHEPNFRGWLAARGSAILSPTNPYEILRFLATDGVGVIYVNKRGAISAWQGGADDAFRAFIGGLPWRACKPGSRKSKRDRMFATLIQRDGAGCMYCGQPVTEDSFTIEHILSVTHGGTAHPANLSLACLPCNGTASHLSVREKLEMAIRKRTGEAP